MLAKFLIELKLNEEQEKITQIVAGSNGSVSSQRMTSTSMLVKGKYLLREKAKEEMVKVGSLTSVQLAMSIGSQMVAHKGHHCPKYHPRRQRGRCAICGSTRHYTSQCTCPVKSKAKNAEWTMTPLGKKSRMA